MGKLEECKRALKPKRRAGEISELPPKTVKAELLSWAVKEIERLRESVTYAHEMARDDREEEND